MMRVGPVISGAAEVLLPMTIRQTKPTATSLVKMRVGKFHHDPTKAVRTMELRMTAVMAPTTTQMKMITWMMDLAMATTQVTMIPTAAPTTMKRQMRS